LQGKQEITHQKSGESKQASYIPAKKKKNIFKRKFTKLRGGTATFVSKLNNEKLHNLHFSN
jgi:hypothetical protein